MADKKQGNRITGILLFDLVVIGILCLFLVYSGFFNKEFPKVEAVSLNYEEETEKCLFNLLNSEREKPLILDQELKEIARWKAEEMFRRNFFAHKDPVTGKIETFNKIYEKDLYNFIGENLVKKYSSCQEAHTALINSEKHKENIVNIRFTNGAVGCYNNNCVQLFGSK